MSLNIGTLARRAGLTVRALRHYDRIGLLRPPGRAGNGYRQYGPDDVARLHRIQALKGLGLPLAEIKACLDSDQASPRDIIGRRIRDLDARIDAATALRDRLVRLDARLAAGGRAGIEDWLTLLEKMRLLDAHLSPEEQDVLARRGRSDDRQDRRAAAILVADVARAAAQGLPPEHPDSRRLAQAFVRHVLDLTDGDPDLALKLGAMCRVEDRARELFGLDAAAVDWLSRASRPHRRNRSKTPNQGGPMSCFVPESTAVQVARYRAVHQLLDDPLVFEDPLALAILGPNEEESLRADLKRHDHPLLRGLRASIAVRSRLAEDEWAEARHRGVHQRLILGAGLDTFAYRCPDPAGVRVYEADLPAAQEAKRRLLAAAGIAPPEGLVFAPVDFERASLAQALAAAGFSTESPTFVSWLGVTMYLEEQAVFETLRFVAGLAPRSSVVFDYALPPALLSAGRRAALERISSKAAERGEPWKTFLDPAALAERLADMGFRQVTDLGPDELNARYLAGRADGLRKGGLTRIVRALV